LRVRAPDWLTARPVAHRGLHDRARGIIENMPGAALAAIEGNFSIECDIQLTVDGEDRADTRAARALRPLRRSDDL
jgi:glycerophosphoryl diester phosphodiesterase